MKQVIFSPLMKPSQKRERALSSSPEESEKQESKRANSESVKTTPTMGENNEIKGMLEKAFEKYIKEIQTLREDFKIDIEMINNTIQNKFSQ